MNHLIQSASFYLIAGSKRGQTYQMYGANKKGQPPLKAIVVLLVRVEGLEPSRREAPDPKSAIYIFKIRLTMRFIHYQLLSKKAVSRIKIN